MDNLNTDSSEYRVTKSGITKRWLVTTILVITLVLLFIDISVITLIKGYYYKTVERKLQSLGQGTTIADYFSSYIGSAGDGFSSRAHEYVANFNEMSVAEVWVVNKNGEVIVTSTGFISTVDEIYEYNDAVASPSGRAFWQGRLNSGEKVMTLTTMLPLTNGESNGAVRYLISLELVDKQIIRIAHLTTGVSLFALSLVVISGMFFVRSIVGPVKIINDAARSIAAGNFSQKVPVSDNYDELAELAESINYMTEEIDKTYRMKNDFISTVSHELRTPLTAIKGWTETLLCINETSDKTVNDGLHVILHETERLYSLVEELLDFSKIESGRMTLHLEKIDVLADLDEAVIVLRDRAMREGINISYSLPDTPAPMNGDADRLKQVFVNIIDNAVKYTAEGGRIEITAAMEKGLLKIMFSDNGCGISSDDLPHVKEKFYKADISAKGSGIGLAVCDEIVSLHNGTLDITSVYGHGTTVTVALPLSSVKDLQ